VSVRDGGHEIGSEDKALVGRLLRGDERAFDAFFDSYFPGLYRFALSRLRHDTHLAEEVAQAALCQAVRKLATYRGEAALFTWLCAFCRHEISAHYRRHPESARVELREEAAEIRAALDLMAAGSGADPESALQKKEVARLVQMVLDHLPRHYGDALEWKYIEGASVVEIAARLSLSPKAAESVLTRARVAFRSGFEELCRGSLPWVREVAR
jgi:RNA polymerase sigma-70 factor (ECF subfamily)